MDSLTLSLRFVATRFAGADRAICVSTRANHRPDTQLFAQACERVSRRVARRTSASISNVAFFDFQLDQRLAGSNRIPGLSSASERRSRLRRHRAERNRQVSYSDCHRL